MTCEFEIQNASRTHAMVGLMPADYHAISVGPSNLCFLGKLDLACEEHRKGMQGEGAHAYIMASGNVA